MRDIVLVGVGKRVVVVAVGSSSISSSAGYEKGRDLVGRHSSDVSLSLTEVPFIDWLFPAHDAQGPWCKSRPGNGDPE